MITPLLDTLRLQKIDDDVYFSKKYSNYISNSRLGLINPEQGGSPEKFFEGFPKTFSSSLVNGSAVHCLCLQEDLFYLAPELGKPTAKMGAMADLLYGENQPSREDIISASQELSYYSRGLTDARIEDVYAKCTDYWERRKVFENGYNDTKTPIYLDSKSRGTVSSCVNAVKNNKAMQQLLHPVGLLSDPISENEQAILLDVKVELPDTKPFILRLKSKLDNYTIDTESSTITVNDIKTTGKILSEFNNAVSQYHYRRELGMYMYLLCLCAEKYYGIKDPICKGNFLVVSTIPQYYTKVVPMTKKDFILGFNEFKKLLELVAQQVATKYKDFGIWI